MTAPVRGNVNSVRCICYMSYAKLTPTVLISIEMAALCSPGAMLLKAVVPVIVFSKACMKLKVHSTLRLGR